MSDDTSYPTIRCPLMEGRLCLREECASHTTWENEKLYHDWYVPIPEEDKWETVEEIERGFLRCKVVEKKKLKPQFRYKYLNYYKIHYCLKVKELYHFCRYFNKDLWVERKEFPVDFTKFVTGVYLRHSPNMSRDNSSPTTVKEEEKEESVEGLPRLGIAPQEPY